MITDRFKGWTDAEVHAVSFAIHTVLDRYPVVLLVDDGMPNSVAEALVRIHSEAIEEATGPRYGSYVDAPRT